MRARVLARYRLLDLVGADGTGEVCRPRDEHLDRNVAVNVLPEAMAVDPARGNWGGRPRHAERRIGRRGATPGERGVMKQLRKPIVAVTDQDLLMAIA